MVGEWKVRVANLHRHTLKEGPGTSYRSARSSKPLLAPQHQKTPRTTMVKLTKPRPHPKEAKAKRKPASSSAKEETADPSGGRPPTPHPDFEPSDAWRNSYTRYKSASPSLEHSCSFTSSYHTSANSPLSHPPSRTQTPLTALTTNTDEGDESLARYKASLGLGSGGKDLSDPNDPRVCVILSLSMETPGRDAVTIDLSAAGSENSLKEKPFKIKEGAKFIMVATFKVQHEILSGLHYVQIVKRKGIKVSKDSEMIGSYAPNTEKQATYTKRCEFGPRWDPRFGY